MGRGRVFQFPNRPGCPPHDWVGIYDESAYPNDDEEIVTGRVCVKCSLIETKESLALMLASQPVGVSGGKDQGFLPLRITAGLSSSGS
jgi:hypothetical protein